MSRQHLHERYSSSNSYSSPSSTSSNTRRNNSTAPAYSSLGEALGGHGARAAYMQNTFHSQDSSTVENSIPQFTADGRYNYPSATNNPAGMASAYDYAVATYPSSYDTTQFTHNSLPPMRSAASLGQANNPSSQYNAQQPYQQPYPHGQYAIAAPSQQWGTESWSANQQSFQSSSPESVYVGGRHEFSETIPDNSRVYATQQSSQSDVTSRRSDNRSTRGEASSTGRGKEKEQAGNAPSSAESSSQSFTVPLIDFAQISDIYRSTLSGSNNMMKDPSIMDGNAPSLETIDSMLRLATLGRQLLDPQVEYSERRWREAESDNVNIEREPQPEAEVESSSIPTPGPLAAHAVHDGQRCLGCGATSTPEWRRGPLGPRTLCNACGLVYAKMIKKRSRDLTNFIPATNVPSASATFRHQDEDFPGSGDDRSGDEQSSSSPRPTKY